MGELDFGLLCCEKVGMTFVITACAYPFLYIFCSQLKAKRYMNMLFSGSQLLSILYRGIPKVCYQVCYT